MISNDFAITPSAESREAQDRAHTPYQHLGQVALSPELRAEIDAIKREALAELRASGQIPAEHLPEVAPLSAENRAAVDAVKADFIANGSQPTT